MQGQSNPIVATNVAFVRYHNVVLPVAVKNSFIRLSKAVNESIGFTIEPVDGYRSRAQIIEELKKRVKYPKRDLLDADADGTYVESLLPTMFEPPLTGNIPALRDPTGNEQVYTIPNMPAADPRLTGRIVKIGPKSLINPTLLYFLVHNAGNYGFVHYGPKDPSIWYWRGDLTPKIYTPQEVVGTFTSELNYLL